MEFIIIIIIIYECLCPRAQLAVVWDMTLHTQCFIYNTGASADNDCALMAVWLRCRRTQPGGVFSTQWWICFVLLNSNKSETSGIPSFVECFCEQKHETPNFFAHDVIFQLAAKLHSTRKHQPKTAILSILSICKSSFSLKLKRQNWETNLMCLFSYYI